MSQGDMSLPRPEIKYTSVKSVARSIPVASRARSVEGRILAQKRSRCDEGESTSALGAPAPKKACLPDRDGLAASMPAESVPVPHPVLYFKDGDITLCAHPFLFKVHTSQLAAESEFFEDMFKVACPDETEKTEDGLRINMNGIETAWDLAVWLSMIYKDLYRLRVNTACCKDIDFIRSLYHLGSKYHRPDYCASARDKLCALFTSSYQDYARSPHGSLSTAFRAIPIAKAYCPSALPLAYYTASSARLEFIIHGLPNPADPTHPSTLSPDDQFAVLRGKERRRSTLKTTYAVFTEIVRRHQPLNDCSNRPHMKHGRTCFEALVHWYARLEERGYFESEQDCFARLPLDIWDAILGDVCIRCSTKLQVKFWIGQREAWNCLPDMFGLYSWLDVFEDQKAIDRLLAE